MTLCKHNISFLDKCYRLIWCITYNLLFRFSPVFFHGYRRLILRVFGAIIGPNVHIYPSVKIWSPRNLVMEAYSCIGPNVDCYNVAKVTLGNRSIVSQNCVICTASHNYDSNLFELVAAPIFLHDGVWIASYSFIAPGVVVLSNTVVLARSLILSSLDSNSVYAGAPAKFKKFRKNAYGSNE